MSKPVGRRADGGRGSGEHGDGARRKSGEVRARQRGGGPGGARRESAPVRAGGASGAVTAATVQAARVAPVRGVGPAAAAGRARRRAAGVRNGAAAAPGPGAETAAVRGGGVSMPGGARRYRRRCAADVTMNVKALYLMRGRFERLNSHSRRAARTAASIGVFSASYFSYR
jgi:hypothetical protein